MPDNIFILDISESKSSLIQRLEYNETLQILTIYFRKYYVDVLSYKDVSINHFEEFAKQKSIGKYYLHYIKPNFKQTKTPQMAEKPKTKNQASNDKRFIKISLNVREIKKEWLFEGEKGTYMNATLVMLPDGKVDDYGNLGFIVQDVPKAVYETEKHLQAKDRTKGPILGNAAEMDWAPRNEAIPGQEVGNMLGEGIVDDLPF